MTTSLTVSVSVDGMAATITGVDPGVSVRQAEAHIRNALTRAGVVEGFLDEVIAAAGLQLATYGRVPPITAARGRPAHPGTFAGAHIDAVVYDSSVFEPDPVPPDGVLYAVLSGKVPNPVIVKEGDRVGRYLQGDLPCAGTTVTGKPLPVAHEVKPPAAIKEVREHLRILPNGDIVAHSTGILLRTGDSCALLPVNSNGGFSVEVSNDRLTVDLILFPAGPGGVHPGCEDIQRHLESMGIRGTDTVAIEQVVSGSEPRSTAPRRAVVARGAPPRRGDDGKAELLVNLEFSHRPSIREDGRADYYSVHQFETVVADQPLVRLHPPRLGTAGIDVFGNRIRSESGIAVAVRFGRGVRVCPQDASVLVANRDGHVYMRKDTLVVEEVLRIYSDVDFHTGNIQFPGDVVISGEVRSGFSVRANGSVRVYGAIEDATIIAGEDVIVSAGLLGQGRGVIRAGGNVVVSFVRNQTIAARGSIMVGGEVVDARLYAGDSLLAESRRSRVVGGEVMARNLIRCSNLGGESGHGTRVCAGIDFVILKRIRNAASKVQRMEKERAARTGEMELLTKEERSRGGLSPDKGLVRARLGAAIQDLTEKIGLASALAGELEEQAYHTDARVVVSGEVCPNVSIEIARSTHTVQKKLQRCFFYLQGDRIRFQSSSASP